MKRLLLSIALVLGMLACGGQPAFAGQLEILWDYDFSNDTACATGTQTSCLFEFVVYHTNPSTGAQITDVTVPLVSPDPNKVPSTTGLVTGLNTGIFVTKNQYGLNSYCVIARAKDPNSIFVPSTPACVGAQQRPGGALNVRYITP